MATLLAPVDKKLSFGSGPVFRARIEVAMRTRRGRNAIMDNIATKDAKWARDAKKLMTVRDVARRMSRRGYRAKRANSPFAIAEQAQERLIELRSGAYDDDVPME